MRAGKHTLLRSFLWLGSASAFARVVDLAAIAIVIGLVTPEQVGEASIAWTVVTLCEPFASAGMHYALLTVRRLDRLQRDTATWLALGAGVLSTLLVAALAPAFAWLAHAPQVAPMIMVGALKLFPAALAALPQQRLARALRHREIAAASACATLLAALTRVVLASNGAGAWAFVIAHAAYSAVLLAALWWTADLTLRLRFDRARARELLRLGLPSTLSQALLQWARNIDYLFVGAFLGMAPLGLYRVAFDLAMEPVIATGEVVARSATPTLHKLARTPDRLDAAFGYSMKLSLAISLPLSLLIFCFAPRLLELARDHSFVAASDAARWLAVAAVLRMLLGLYTPLALALGQPRLALRTSFELLALLTLALALCVGALGSSLSIASAGVAWCAALVLVLAITRARFRSARRLLLAPA
jgi:O-antigen/teichoic acid export membrane protein